MGLNPKYAGEKYFNRSAQANFAKNNIPIIFYNTDDHPDYHHPTDEADKINPEKLARIARLAFLVAWKVVDSDLQPSYKRQAFSCNSQILTISNPACIFIRTIYNII